VSFLLILRLILKETHVLMQFLLVQLPCVSIPLPIRLDPSDGRVCRSYSHLLKVRFVIVHIQSIDGSFGPEEPFALVLIRSVGVVRGISLLKRRVLR
jgi:hypothetical protein